MIWLITLLALFLRLINLNQSLWLDEAIEVVNASSHSIKYLYAGYSIGDFHPPLYHLILRLWYYLFPSSELFSRLPSLILGVGTVYLIYLIGRKLYDEKTGLIAALLLATAPLHIYYSQEARMYVLAAFLASASVYFFLSVLEKDKLYNWTGFIIATTLLLYTDYLPYLLVFLYIPYLVLMRKKIARHTLVSFVPAFLLIFILLIPWMFVFSKQLQVGLSAANASPAWAQVVGAANLKDLALTFVKFTIGRISNDNNLTYALLFMPVAFFITGLFMLSTYRMSPKRAFLYVWFFAPPFAAFVVSFFIPIYSYFRLVFILPAFYLIWASAINTVNWALPTRILLTLAIAVNLTCLTIYYLNPKFQRENWRQATNFVTTAQNNNSLILFESETPFAPFDYYNKGKAEAKGALHGFSANEKEIEQKLETLTKNRTKVFLFQYLSEITDPYGLVFQELTRLGFHNTATKNFNGVGFVYEFTR